MIHTSAIREEGWVDPEKRFTQSLLWFGGTLLAGLTFLILLRMGYAYKWTCFREQTLWNWLQLLLTASVILI